MQSEGRLAPGQIPRYKGVFDAYATIVRTEGILGLWTGLGPAVARNSIINATELATYEQTKEALIARGMSEGIPLHIAAATCAGLMATIIGNPIDVIKTRVMAARNASGGTSAAASGAFATIAATLRDEGPAAFYKGVLPQFFRLTGWSIVMFSTLEQLRKALRETLNQREA
jgi:solute carrier family 25 uncoupling protein 8/9